MAAAESDGGMEFRSYVDEAWYSVTLAPEEAGEALRVKFVGFGADNDAVFRRGDFADAKRVDDFAARFRPVSDQLQDSQCSRVANGLLVCASHHFSNDDVRFYDALVDGVDRFSHDYNEENEEVCSCSFILSWLHGPNAGKITDERLAQICRVQYRAEMNPIVASFVKRSRKQFELPPKTTRIVKTEAHSNHHEELPRMKIGHMLNFSHHLKQEGRSIKWSFSDPVWSKWTFARPADQNDHDTDIGGVGKDYMIVIENIEVDLTPLVVIEFVHKQVSVSSRAFILPTLPWEISTRCGILLDNKAKFVKLLDFLRNPNQIVVSSAGRPWVMSEAKPVDESLQTSVKNFMLVSQKISEAMKSGSKSELKVVRSGTEQFSVAKQLSDLYEDVSDHQKRLEKRRVVEEGEIWKKHKAERRVGI